MKIKLSESKNKVGDIYGGKVVSDCCEAELDVQEIGVSQISFDLKCSCKNCGKNIPVNEN